MVTIIMKNKRLYHVSNAKIAHMYVDNHMSIFEIGNVLDVSGATVSRRLSAMAIPTRKQCGKKPRPISNAAIAHAYADNNMSTPQIGKMFGMSSTAISDRLYKMAIPMKPVARYCSGYPGLHSGYLDTICRDGTREHIHRGCWEAHNGPIPEKYIVHHIDGNRLNNDIENLKCMTKNEHTKLHNNQRGR